jgi:hypothetical protein
MTGHQTLVGNIIDPSDAPIVTRSLRRPFWLPRRIHDRLVKIAARALINRLNERGVINSYAYHEAHAMIDRVWPLPV